MKVYHAFFLNPRFTVVMFCIIFITRTFAQSSWDLNGNSNVGNNNFIGTTNQSILLFKSNNQEAMRIFPTGSVGINVGVSHNGNNNFYYHKLTVNGPTNLVGEENALQISSSVLSPNGTRHFTYFSNKTFPNSTVQYTDIGAYEFLEPSGTIQNGKHMILQSNDSSRLGVGAFGIAPPAKLSVNGTGYFSDNVGLGTTTPLARLDVRGVTRTTGLQIPTGAATGRVLISDANGNATWQTFPTNVTNTWRLNGNTASGNQYIGTNNNEPLVLKANNIEGLRVNPSGSVSIGLPRNMYYYDFEVEGRTTLTGPTGADQVNLFNIYSGDNTTAKYLAGYRHYFSFTHEKFVQNNEEYGVFNAVEYADTPPAGQPASSGKHMIIQKSTEGNLGIGFFDAPPVAKLTVNGTVAIGDNYVPAGYAMSVKGKIIAEEVAVKLRNKWGDFVFDEDFELMKLADVEAFVKENKHLPGVPSAMEIEKNGLEIGEMENILMQKVEQLTLYAIEQEKIIGMQEERFQYQEKKMAELLQLIELQNQRIENIVKK